MSPWVLSHQARRVAIWLALAGCAGENPPVGGDDDDDIGDDDDDDDDDDIPTEVELSATGEATSISQAMLSLELSAPATVAGACVRRDDPTEVHLLEAEGASPLTLHFSGLLASTDYDCSVAALSPPSPPVEVSFRTPDAPFEHASATATVHDDLEMTGTYTVMNVRPECFGPNAQNYLTVLDPEGNNRWRYDLPRGLNIGIEVLPDGPNRFLWGGGRDKLGGPAVIDVVDGVQWKYDGEGNDDIIYHHDVNRIEDGRVLSVEEHDDAGWDAFQLRLIDQDSGETSWFWDVQSAVADGFLPPVPPGTDDPHHLNWADVVETDNGLVAYGSLCYSFQTIAVDVASSEPLWIFGPGGDFTLVDAAGNPLPDQDDFPECQHGLQMDGTHLLVYDNGFNRGYTRAVEYTLDQQAMTAHKTWEWLDEGYWELYHGGTDWLTPDHNRVLVAQGNNDCGNTSDRHSQVVELDRESNTEVHRLILDDIGHWIYRAHRVEGCDVFANTKYCPALATRLDELRDDLGL